jgi:TonB family protein
MKFCFSFLLLIVFGNVSLAQTNARKNSDTSVVKAVTPATEDKPAEFPGGSEGWRMYLEKNLKYPKKARRAEIQGVVRVQFIVGKNGDISEVSILTDPGGGLGDEVVRLISTGPKWVPAEKDGKKVIYRHIQAVTFSLQ